MKKYCCSSRKSLLIILLFGTICSYGLVSGSSQQNGIGTLAAEEEQVVGALQAAQEPQSEESYQRVYEAFTKLIQNVSNNSLGNARRLVSRLNQLVGSSSSGGSGQAATIVEISPPSVTSSKPAIASNTVKEQQQQQQQQQQQNVDERTEQILNRLDQVNNQTDQNTLRQLQEDVNRLVGTLSDSYLRNIRRLIERVDRVVGGNGSGSARPSPGISGANKLHQSGDRFQQENEANRPPGFPGWDELIVAVDRMQKSLASFVRSSTKLITSGRR